MESTCFGGERCPLQPAWKAPADCASHQFRGPRDGRIVGDGRLALRDVVHQPLRRLRTLADRDCWVRAWLRFGRAPVMERGIDFRSAILRPHRAGLFAPQCPMTNRPEGGRRRRRIGIVQPAPTVTHREQDVRLFARLEFTKPIFIELFEDNA